MQKMPSLQNLFLRKQGAEFPPNTCLSSTDSATFAEQLDVPITSPDPTNPSQQQQLGAFQFEVHYDATLICLQLVAGPAASGMLCTIQDDTNSTLVGIARIHCMINDLQFVYGRLGSNCTNPWPPQPPVNPKAPTATFTPTLTATSTPTSTPTSTLSPTPSPTSTPPPPVGGISLDPNVGVASRRQLGSARAG